MSKKTTNLGVTVKMTCSRCQRSDEAHADWGVDAEQEIHEWGWRSFVLLKVGSSPYRVSNSSKPAPTRHELCPDCVKALDGFMRGANPGEGAESD